MTTMLRMQVAEDYDALHEDAVRELEGIMPSPTAVFLRPDPTFGDANLSAAMREFAAGVQGWDSADERDAVLSELRVWAVRVVEQRAAVDDPCCDWTDVLEGLEDRVAAGVIALPFQPWKTGAVGDLCRLAARTEWRAVQRAQERAQEQARRDADELAREWEAC